MRVSHNPPPLFSARVLRHLKHGIFATWLYRVYIQNSYRDGQIPTGWPNSCQDDLNFYQDGHMMEGQEFVWA